jgi:hypothetical protein
LKEETMTVGELIAMLAKRDPSEIVVLALFNRHGDSSYLIADDALYDGKVEWEGREYSAVWLGTSGCDEVEPLPG